LGILITAYVDDHHFVRMHKEDLLNDLSVFKSIFHNANVPLEDDKESVSQIVSFLGVVINTVSWSITLKPSTFRTLCVKVDAWLLLTKVSIRDIMKMLGNFLWASIAFMGGGTFSSRLMQSLRMRFANNHFASINIRTTAYVSYIRLDLLWWKAILALPYLHGRPISDLNPPVVEIFTDACPSGIGGWFSIASIAHFYALILPLGGFLMLIQFLWTTQPGVQLNPVIQLTTTFLPTSCWPLWLQLLHGATVGKAELLSFVAIIRACAKL
jgi:hypothetical protein